MLSSYFYDIFSTSKNCSVEGILCLIFSLSNKSSFQSGSLMRTLEHDLLNQISAMILAVILTLKQTKEEIHLK